MGAKQRAFNIYCSQVMGWKLIKEQGIEFYTENGKHIHSIYSYDPWENCNQMAVVFDKLPKSLNAQKFMLILIKNGIKKTMQMYILQMMGEEP